MRISPRSRSQSPGVPGEGVKRVGYLIGNDQYFKHDDVGIVYQLNVVPGKQRGLIGATLLKAQFERSAYGCKLYCCWCAQDIAANRFSESVGFVPLAFRAGSEKKSRVHIFWQKRIRQGDTTTPWWFPSQTTGGSIREDRLVLPIPPGTHWQDAKPLLLPRGTHNAQLTSHGSTELTEVKEAPSEKRSKRKAKAPAEPVTFRAMSGLRAGPPPMLAIAKSDAPKRPKTKAKNDPKFVAAARELRDRWLEKVAEEPALLASSGKYDVTRAIASTLDSNQPAFGAPVMGKGARPLLAA